MGHEIHGASVHSTATPGSPFHEQDKVIETTELELQRMKDGKLEVHPVAEYNGELGGKKGTYKVFFAHEKA